MENVMGILSAAVKHRPIKERGKGFPPLTEDEKRGSALGQILQKIDDTGYTVSYWHLNAADFGVPQVRHRVFFIGCRDRIELDPPVPTHDKRGGVTLPWINLREVIQDLFEKDRRGLAFSPRTRHYLKKIPAGCNWKALPRRSWKRAIRGAYDSSGGRTGFLRRLSWDTPAPTLVAYPLARATCMCHPEENRPLSIREYARIQQFPDDWIFAGGLGRQYKMIGNAVPVGLAQAVGEAIASKLRQHLNQDSELKGMPEPVFQHVRV
jgi:DNA (cytosine-5)-methyltransferase 1